MFGLIILVTHPGGESEIASELYLVLEVRLQVVPSIVPKRIERGFGVVEGPSDHKVGERIACVLTVEPERSVGIVIRRIGQFAFSFARPDNTKAKRIWPVYQGVVARERHAVRVIVEIPLFDNSRVSA